MRSPGARRPGSLQADRLGRQTHAGTNGCKEQPNAHERLTLSIAKPLQFPENPKLLPAGLPCGSQTMCQPCGDAMVGAARLGCRLHNGRRLETFASTVA